MSLALRRNILTVDGDPGLYASGNPVYETPTKRGRPARPLVAVGQPVIFDPDTLQSLGAGITQATNPKISIGIGWDTNGDGAADVIKKITGEYLQECVGCHSDITAQAPSCGLVGVEDLYITCVEPDKTYSIDVVVEDNDTEGFAARNRGFVYTFSYRTATCDCEADGCSPTASADDVVCGLVRAIKGEPSDWDIFLNGEPFSDEAMEMPFTAEILRGGTGATVTYCLTPTAANACDDCVFVEDIKGISVDGVQTDFTSTVVDVGGTDYTPTSRLEAIRDEINDVLGTYEKGSATLVKGTGPCCDYKLEINSCVGENLVFLVDNTDTEITNCGETDPFADITITNSCPLCTGTDSTVTPTAGIRFFAKGVETPCECYPGNNTKAWTTREIAVYPKFGFDECGGARKRTQQKATLPEGMGYTWEEREQRYLRHGGAGYDHLLGKLRGGKHHLPVGDDKLLKASVKCNESYCVIAIKHSRLNIDQTVRGTTFRPRFESYILIPDGSSTTKSDLTGVLNTYFGSSISC